ncbi:VOC family protein [Spirillospora sp. CA-294931]|uniref:VOC family protein n=1 Tax=Spirillospora sp. CA-294931 TaxID=3240042 RepID=UPI003D8E47C5
MTDGYVRLRAITVDCRDPERLGAFWSAVLGRPITSRTGPYVWLDAPGDGVELGFQKVEEPTPGKTRAHLDLMAADPLAEQRRIESLGGRRLPEYDGGGFLVMADPEGNEFCVLPEGPAGLDGEGNAHYLPGALS